MRLLTSMTGMAQMSKVEGASVERGKSAHQLLFQIADDLTDVGVHFHAVFDEAAGVQHHPHTHTPGGRRRARDVLLRRRVSLGQARLLLLLLLSSS